MRLQQYIRFPPAVVRWLFEPRLFWIAVTITGGLLVLAFVGHETELRVRSIGATLQLLGISTVAWGLRQARLLFEKPALLALFKHWWERRARLRGRIISGVGRATMPSMTAAATGHAFVRASPDDSVDVRLRALEENFRLGSERLNRIESESRRELARVESLIHSESQKLVAKTEVLSHKLDTSWTGGIYVSAVGLIWLAVGAILVSFPNELATW